MAEVKSFNSPATERVVINTRDSLKPSVVIDAPGNSFKDREATAPAAEAGTDERRTVAAVASGRAKPKRESKIKKAFTTLIGDDVQDLKGYILGIVLVPILRRGLMDFVGALLGEPTRRYGDYPPPVGTTYSYQRYWNDRNGYGARRGAPPQEASRGRYPFDDVYVNTPQEAQEILNNLQDLINDYGSARVADLYESARLPSKFTDGEWGWYDIRDATYRQTRDGVLIIMPRAVSLRG